MAKILILDPIWGPGNYLDNVPSYHPMQFLGKLINQTWKNDKKPNFGPPFFLWVLSLLVVRHCSKLSFYAIYRKTKEPNLRKWWKKPNFEQHFDLLGPNLTPTFFLWVLPLLVFRYCFKLSLYSISRKTNKANLGKWQKT